MKRIFRTLLAVMILALVITAFTACDLDEILAIINPTPACEHEWVEATCTAPKTCSKCNETEGEALEHTEVVDAAVSATCTESGLSEGKHCSVCNTVLVKQETVAALGHDEVPHEAKAPDCKNIGWDAYVTCSRCEYTTYVELASTGEHGGGEATCVSKAICSGCGDEYGDLDPNNHKNTVALEDTAVAATCGKAGKEADTYCNDCEKTVATGAEISATGEHNYVEDHDCTKANVCSGCDGNDGNVSSHVWSDHDSDCSTAEVCTNANCTVVNSEIKSHDYPVNAEDCTASVKCNNCDAVKNGAEAHSYSAWTVVDGKHVKACENCNHSESHDPETTDDGDCSTAVVCSCGIEVVAAKSHNLTGPVYSRDYYSNLHTYSCDNEGCNHTETEVCSYDGTMLDGNLKCTKCGHASETIWYAEYDKGKAVDADARVGIIFDMIMESGDSVAHVYTSSEITLTEVVAPADITYMDYKSIWNGSATLETAGTWTLEKGTTVKAIPFTATEKSLSADAGYYWVVSENGWVYRVYVSKYSMLIGTSSDLLTAHENTVVVDNYFHSAQFKLTADIDMSGVTWTKDNQIASTSVVGGGFFGLFDGNNKTISNLVMNFQDSGIFDRISVYAVVQNLTIKDASLGHCSSGVLTNEFYAGTYKNINISFAASNTWGDNGWGVAAFGERLNNDGALTMEDITVTANLDSCADNKLQYAPAVYFITKEISSTTAQSYATNVTWKNVNATGATCLIQGCSDAITVSTLEDLASYANCTDVTFVQLVR